MNNSQIDLNKFYRKNYSRLLFFLTVMIFTNLILGIYFIYLSVNIPLPITLAAFENKTTPLYALTEPVISQNALLEWASQVAISVYNIDYLNYRKQLAANQSYFSPAGWQVFLNDFRTVLGSIIGQKLRASAVLTGSPVILEQGPLFGRYAWKVRMPMLITYESASELRNTPIMVDMVIMRVPTTDSPKGIAVSQFFARESDFQLGL